MSIIAELAMTPGVIAAGEYSYRGDRFSYEGNLDEEKARMASIMCRATTMAVHMQIDMLKSLNADCGSAPARGWVVKGEKFTVCAIANVFCFVDNASSSLNEIMEIMRDNIAGQEGVMV
jgi:roadblock/LC7 domain-containing protein